MPGLATADPSTSFASAFAAIVGNVGRAVQGKAEAVQLAVMCVLAEGHLLLEDVPGVGKTTLAKSLAASLQATFGRVQFTPDLLPSDVVGVNVYDRNQATFTFQPGPVFNNLLLGDEINRASPKTQSALLEAMAERQVTVDGTTYALPSPFMVIATQNPVEHEGTYPLPESQLDRFLMRVSMGYPSRDAEIAMLDAHGGGDDPQLQPVVRGSDLLGLMAYARTIHMAGSLKEYLVQIAEATRRHPRISLGMSPRATLNLQRAARVRAAAAGRNYVVPDDIKALAIPVLGHRVVVSPEAQLAGLDSAAVIAEVVAGVPVPTNRGR